MKYVLKTGEDEENKVTKMLNWEDLCRIYLVVLNLSLYSFYRCVITHCRIEKTYSSFS